MTSVPSTEINPDHLDQETISTLLQEATTFGFNNGLLMFDSNNLPFLAPITLFPRQTPASVYARIWETHPALQELYAKVANDHDFLLESLKPMTADPFISMLVSTLEQNKGRVDDPICLVSRSDYMIHENDYNAVQNTAAPTPTIPQPAEIRLPNGIGYTPLQVEFNTISTAFTALSQRVQNMHRYLMTSHQIQPHSTSSPTPPVRTFPQHQGPDGAADTFAAATALMTERYPQFPNKNEWVVIMVVQAGESNAADQRLIEYTLLEKHNIRLIRATLNEIHENVQFGTNSVKSTQPPMWTFHGQTKSPLPISLFYYRSCYTPRDFKIGDDHNEPLSEQSQALISTYQSIEASAAIKCPNIGLHLSGTKKIQQLLTQREILKKYVLDEETCDNLLKIFTSIYSLQSKDYSSNSDIVQRAIEHPHEYVLKPMREGGGNNLYDEELSDFLKNKPIDEINTMILMKRISPDTKVKAIMLRKGQVSVVDSVSEYGIFGGFLGFIEKGTQNDQNNSQNGQNDPIDLQKIKVLHNQAFGSLVRIKASGVNEGGVAAGFSCVGSAILE